MIKIPSEFFNRRIFHTLLGKNVIHLEASHITRNELITHLKKYHSLCYCITPINYEYVKNSFGCNMSEKEFHQYVKEFYLKLKNMGINLQLHVHISQSLNKLTFKEKARFIKEAYNFFKDDLKITPREIVFGWTSFDKDCLEIAKSLNLKVIKHKHFHIYDFWLNMEGYNNNSIERRHKMVARIAKGKILDIGFADNPNYYLRGDITGLDMRKVPLPKNYSKSFQGNLNKLNIKISERFDTITALEFIEHIDNHPEFFRKCNSLLKKDGILILTTPTPYYYKTIIGNLLFPRGRATIIPHMNDFVPRILNNVAILNGFKVIDVRNVNSIFPLINWQLLYIYKKI